MFQRSKYPSDDAVGYFAGKHSEFPADILIPGFERKHNFLASDRGQVSHGRIVTIMIKTIIKVSRTSHENRHRLQGANMIVDNGSVGSMPE